MSDRCTEQTRRHNIRAIYDFLTSSSAAISTIATKEHMFSRWKGEPKADVAAADQGAPTGTAEAAASGSEPGQSVAAQFAVGSLVKFFPESLARNTNEHSHILSPIPSIVALFAATLFLSAGLLFLVEPMIAKMVLPRLGGSPSVWSTCLVFFQATLLFGYAYAHALTHLEPRA